MKEEHTDKQGKQLVNACQGLEADMVFQLCNGISKLYLEKMRKKKKKQNERFVLLQNIGTHPKLKIRIKPVVS